MKGKKNAPIQPKHEYGEIIKLTDKELKLFERHMAITDLVADLAIVKRKLAEASYARIRKIYPFLEDWEFSVNTDTKNLTLIGPRVR